MFLCSSADEPVVCFQRNAFLAKDKEMQVKFRSSVSCSSFLFMEIINFFFYFKLI